MIRVVKVTGFQAIRTPRIGLLAVDSSVAPLHVVPSQVRVFGLFTVFVPVFDRYAMLASTESVLSRYWMDRPFSV
jgi:hypothetical protein